MLLFSQLLYTIRDGILVVLNFLLYVRSIVFTDSFLFTLKLISSFISAVLFAGIIWLVMKMRVFGLQAEQLSDMMAMAQVDRKRVLKAWKEVRDRLEKGDEANLRLAIIDADKLLDTVLKRMGYVGDTMADRLKKITKAQLRSINELWSAHKVRNNIVHSPDHALSYQEAVEVVGIYERVFREMNLID
ncbi:MAG: hypothetical protein HZA36_02820 [Parcubacteria group bacterium]|nr:hypothetical protein [Parcubacteria group bacterium]